MKRNICILVLLLSSFLALFAGEINDFYSIPFGTSKAESTEVLKSKGFKIQKEPNITYDSMGGVLEIVMFTNGNYAGKKDVTIYLYFFRDQLFQADAINWDSSWDTILNSFINKYDLKQDKNAPNCYRDSHDVYVLKVKYPPMLNGIRLVNEKTETEILDYAKQWEDVNNRKKLEEAEKLRKQQQELIDNDI